MASDRSYSQRAATWANARRLAETNGDRDESAGRFRRVRGSGIKCLCALGFRVCGRWTFLVDDDQVEELRGWATCLAEDERPEVRAAAKAILLLANDLLAARSQMLEDRWIKQALEEQQASVERTLLNRLRRRVQASSQSKGRPPEPGQNP
jgi:hypothetical protein